MPRIAIKYYSGSDTTVDVDKFPDECPRCHRHISPIRRIAYLPPDEGPDDLDIAFQCTNEKCGHLFLSRYELAGPSYFEYKRSEPHQIERQTFSKEVEDVSEEFAEIYNQALAAQKLGMSHIGGMGFGKALEFLVKDFAIKQHPEERENIEKSFLGACIKAYIKDENVKLVAERAAWLRNDESHYVRKWEDKDIEDLKNLLTLTLNAIQNVELAAKYTKEMPQGKR